MSDKEIEEESNSTIDLLREKGLPIFKELYERAKKQGAFDGLDKEQKKTLRSQLKKEAFVKVLACDSDKSKCKPLNKQELEEIIQQLKKERETKEKGLGKL